MTKIGAINVLTVGLELRTGGAGNRAKECSFRTPFYHICSYDNPKFPRTGGLDASHGFPGATIDHNVNRLNF